MATNRDLLKEAIADAKAVKEMAIANAKAALEEAFTPQLKTMLSTKIQEMEEEEETIEEVENEKEEIEEEKELDLEAILREMEDDEESEDVTESEEPVTEADDEEAEEEETEEEGDVEDEEESLELEDMTTDDLIPFIKDVIQDMVEAGELPAGEAMEDEDSEIEGEEPEMGDEMVDIEELLSEIDSLEEMDDDYNWDEDPNMVDFLNFSKRSEEGVGMSDEDTEEEEVVDEDLEEIFGMGKKGSGGTSYVKDFIKSNAEAIKSAESSGDKKAAEELIKKFYSANVREMDSSALRSDISVLRTEMGLKPLGGKEKGTVSITEKELSEAHSTIKTLRSELNEVNLLNAKLLHISRIFRSKNLTENQKLKVLGNFDKATSVKEVKLVYETLSGAMKNTSSSPLKESLGSASKVLGTTKTKKPIIEANEAYKRMNEIAFYNSKH